MKKFLIFFILIFFNNLNATNYPNSSTETDRYVNVFYLLSDAALAAGDNVSSSGSDQGLCWFRAGFSLSGTGTVTMATPIPVDREIFLSDRVALDLQKDLVLSGSVRLAKSGNVAAGTGSRLENSIIMNGPFDLGKNTLRFVSGPGLIDGNGNFIDFKKRGKITINSPGYDVKIRNAELRGVHSSNLTPAKGSSISLDNVLLRMDGDYTANTVTGSLNILGDVVVTGTYVFTIDGVCNIYNDCNLYFDVGSTLKIGSNAVFNILSRKRGGIYFNGCNIDVSSKNFLIEAGNIFFANEVTIDDSNNYKHFVAGPYNAAHVLGAARIVLDGTTTFSIL